MGKVFLIGAGPGDPELMTLKAARALGAADVVLLDDLVSRGCLAHARSDVKVIEVGKRGGCKATPQEFIERLLVQYARQGMIVARLKGGDPFVFGRGGEELEALRAAGVDVEVIPGITAGIAAPATLGIPVTHRDVSRGVILVTGHSKDGAEPDWPALARTGLTLVIYMGLARLGEIAAALIAGGMPGDTPAGAIENATLKTQRHALGTVAGLPRAVNEARLASPAIIIVGDVVRYASEFGVRTTTSYGPDPELKSKAA
jgi:uroporphyrin-III C-methyltransferase